MRGRHAPRRRSRATLRADSCDHRGVSIWEYLFDSEHRQREDILALEKQQAETATAAAVSRVSTSREVGNLGQHIARIDLTIEALVQVLERRGQLTREELRDMIVEIDLADGREDAQMGPDRTRKAPKCPSCSRPVNPKRDTCVYCNTALPVEKPRSHRRPYR